MTLTTSSPRPSLSSLPTEIKDMTLDLLDERNRRGFSTALARGQLGALRRVDHEWYYLVESRYWKAVRFDGREAIERVEIFAQLLAPRHAAHIQLCVLDLNWSTFEWPWKMKMVLKEETQRNRAYGRILSILPNLKNLTVCHVPSSFSPSCFTLLLDSTIAPRLTQLNLRGFTSAQLTGISLARVLRARPELYALQLRHVSGDTLGHLEPVLVSLKNLQHLALRSVPSDLQPTFAAHLTRLAIAFGNPSAISYAVKIIEAAAKTLEYLGIMQHDEWLQFDDVSTALSVNLPRLQAVDFHCDFDWSILHLFETSPLRSLHLKRTIPSETDPLDTDHQTLLETLKTHKTTLKQVSVVGMPDDWFLTHDDDDFDEELEWSEAASFCEDNSIKWEFGVERDEF